MANWVKIDNTTKIFTCAAGGVVASGKVHTWIEYDKDRTTPLQTYIRFRGKPINSTTQDTTSYTDAFFVLYNPNNDPSSIGRIIRCIKYYNYKWSHVPDANEIKITKTYDQAGFYIQDYWICNNGKNADYVAKDVVDKDKITTMYNYFNSGRRKNYVCRDHAGSKRYNFWPAGSVATDVGPPKTLTVVKNGVESYKNKFVIKVGPAAAGKLNPVNTDKSFLYYKRPNDSSWQKAGQIWRTVDANYTITLDQDYSNNTSSSIHASKKTQTVAFKAEIQGEYGTLKTFTLSSKTINVYSYPDIVSAPQLYLRTTNGRLTKKKLCYFKWNAVSGKNVNSPVIGYRVRLHKKVAGGSTWDEVVGLSLGTDTKLQEDASASINGGTKSLALRYTAPSSNPSNKQLPHDNEYIHLEGTATNVNSYTFNLGTYFSSPIINVNLDEGFDPNNPSEPYFKVGDSVRLGVYAYTRVPKFSDPTSTVYMFSGGGGTGAQGLARGAKIENSGVVHVKTDAGWVTGDVYVKTETGWVAADAVMVKNDANTWVEAD